MKDNLEDQAVRATKWSMAGQAASKMITPVMQLVLVRILAPEAFAVIGLVTMVTSFADLLSDAGFQKYLIQHEGVDDKQMGLAADVVFWTNIVVSLVLWGIIALFRNQIAALTGDVSIAMPIVLASASLPLTSFVSVQTALFQRTLDFKTLFKSQVGQALTAFCVTVPLALVGFDYWSIIIGTVASNLFLAIWLTLHSSWRPSRRYSLSVLQDMWGFSCWTFAEALVLWLASWIGTVIVSHTMNSWHLGLYTTSVNFVNAAVYMINGAANPVIFSSLSRAQNDKDEFEKLFFAAQKALAFVVVPASFVIFTFREALVGVCMGSQWTEAALFLGCFAVSSAVLVVFGYTAANIYRALGRPMLAFLAQVVFLVVTVPAFFSGKYFGWEMFSMLVPASRIIGTFAAHVLICALVIRISPMRMFASLKWIFVTAIVDAAIFIPVLKFLNIGWIPQLLLIVPFLFLLCIAVVAIPDLRDTAREIIAEAGIAAPLRKILPTKLANLLVSDE